MPRSGPARFRTRLPASRPTSALGAFLRGSHDSRRRRESSLEKRERSRGRCQEAARRDFVLVFRHLDQLLPLALFSADPTILAVGANHPWKSVKDLVADAKKRPGAISYSSSGI